jgi:glutaredoxin 3
MYCVPGHLGCTRAEDYLKSKGVTDIEMAWVDADPYLRTEMWARTERKTLPQIFIGETHVGGFVDLVELDQEGGLDALLKAD